MWLQLAQLVVLVHLDVLGVVDGQELEGVDGNEDAAGVRVDLLLVEARAQVLQDAVLVEGRQVAEVCKVVLGRGEEAPGREPLGLLLLGEGREVDVLDGAVVVALLMREREPGTRSITIQG